MRDSDRSCFSLDPGSKQRKRKTEKVQSNKKHAYLDLPQSYRLFKGSFSYFPFPAPSNSSLWSWISSIIRDWLDPWGKDQVTGGRQQQHLPWLASWSRQPLKACTPGRLPLPVECEMIHCNYLQDRIK